MRAELLRGQARILLQGAQELAVHLVEALRDFLGIIHWHA